MKFITRLSIAYGIFRNLRSGMGSIPKGILSQTSSGSSTPQQSPKASSSKLPESIYISSNMTLNRPFRELISSSLMTFVKYLGITNSVFLVIIIGLISIINNVETVVSSWPHLYNAYLFVASYMPFSAQNVVDSVITLGTILCGWTIALSVNHWDQILAVISTDSDGTLIGSLATVIAFIYETNYDLIIEFIATIWSNPGDLLSTGIIKELVSIYSNSLENIQSLIKWAADHSWSPIAKCFTLFGKGITFIFGSVGNGIGSVVSYCWNALIGGIQSGITPVFPSSIQGFFDPIFKSISTALAGGLVLLIIRIIFGL